MLDGKKIKIIGDYRLYVFCIIVYIIILYSSSLSFPFIEYDNQELILNNNHVNSGITLKNLQWAFSINNKQSWLPVRWVSHMIDFSLFQTNPFGHKLMNLLFHLFNSVLLFILFSRITKRIGLSFFISIIFAIHPMQVESIVWVIGRKDLLSTFFALIAMNIYVLDNDSILTRLLVSIFYILCLLSKPTAWLSFPLILILLDIWPLKRRIASFKDILLNLKSKIIYFIIAFCVLMLNLSLLEKSRSLNHVPFMIKVSNIFIHYFRYLTKIFYPVKLVVLYPYHLNISYPLFVISVMSVSFITYYSIRKYYSNPYLFTGWFWFLLSHLATIGIISAGAQSIADRYNYAPLIGISIIFVNAINLLLDKTRNKRLIYAIMIVVIGLLSLKTYMQIQFWSNSKVLWTHAIDNTEENYIAYTNLGKVLLDEQDPYSLKCFLLSLEIKDDNWQTLYDCAKAYDLRHNYTKSIIYYQKGLKINPIKIECYNLASVYLLNKNYKKALETFKIYLRLQPDSYQAHNNIALVYLKLKNYGKAVKHYKQAIKLNSTSSIAYYNLAEILYYEIKEEGKAIEQLKKCLSIDSSNKDAILFLNYILMKKNN